MVVSSDISSDTDGVPKLVVLLVTVCVYQNVNGKTITCFQK